MKASTTVWPVIARKSMPPVTVPIHTATPDGQVAKGARQILAEAHAIAAPARNGQAVEKTPERTSARWCASRPTAANTRMRTASARAAMKAVPRRAGFAAGMETTISRTQAELEPKSSGFGTNAGPKALNLSPAARKMWLPNVKRSQSLEVRNEVDPGCPAGG